MQLQTCRDYLRARHVSAI